VDVNNLMSLESGLPISLLDLEAVGDRAEIRYGREGESYVFNSAGQAIDLKGLVCICRVDQAGSVPVGNPIKDSMVGKIKEATRGVIGVIYASRRAADAAQLRQWVTMFGELLKSHGGASAVETMLVP
jgi:DNA/RNA-binding domain of Phe-tRNA-synthetase-like protein